jgi:hypothetical protein
MSESAPASPLPAPLRRKKALEASWKHILLNWLVPGLGYWRIGEKTRAKVLFGVWAVFLFFAFLQLSYGAPEGIRGGVYVPQLSPFAWMPTLGAAATSGAGPLYFIFGWAFGSAHGAITIEPVRNLTQEYGASYLMVAGLLNWLACFDIFDRVTGRWIFRLPQDEQKELADAMEKEAPKAE